MTNSKINIDPSKLSDEDLVTLTRAVFKDVKVAYLVYKELSAYHDTLIEEIMRRVEARQ